MPIPTERFHFGKNIWFLNNFGTPNNCLYYGFKTPEGFLEGVTDKLKELIETSNGRYFCLATTSFQKLIAKNCLKELNFKPVVSFYSNHNVSDQILTFWVRVREQKPKINEAEINLFGEGNCSISTMIGANPIDRKKRFTISDEARDGFTQAMKTPIYYRILGDGKWGKPVDFDWNKE